VIYSGHWDHLGVGLPDAKGDKHLQRRVDNADGIAALLELARVREPRRRRSAAMVFLAVTAEERACWARNTMRPTRCIRWPRPSA
jgi:Zn-dependent M28 family amino/carboxypeptidase